MSALELIAEIEKDDIHNHYALCLFDITPLTFAMLTFNSLYLRVAHDDPYLEVSSGFGKYAGFTLVGLSSSS